MAYDTPNAPGRGNRDYIDPTETSQPKGVGVYDREGSRKPVTNLLWVVLAVILAIIILALIF